MRVSAAGNMPLQGLVKPPAKPVVMILTLGFHPKPHQEPEVLGFPSFHLLLCDKWMGDKFQIAAKRSGKSRELSSLVGFGAKPQNVN